MNRFSLSLPDGTVFNWPAYPPTLLTSLRINGPLTQLVNFSCSVLIEPAEKCGKVDGGRLARISHNKDGKGPSFLA